MPGFRQPGGGWSILVGERMTLQHPFILLPRWLAPFRTEPRQQLYVLLEVQPSGVHARLSVPQLVTLRRVARDVGDEPVQQFVGIGGLAPLHFPAALGDRVGDGGAAVLGVRLAVVGGRGVELFARGVRVEPCGQADERVADRVDGRRRRHNDPDLQPAARRHAYLDGKGEG